MDSDNGALGACQHLWNNWTPEGGKNQCQGCPAHWSNREDFPSNAGTRQSSYGHRPWYGDGDLTDVEVVILGHEPGSGSIGEESKADTNWTQHSFDEARNSDVSEVPHGAGSLELTIPLFETVGDAFATYWTQAKKCNEITGEQSSLNEKAEHQCVGIGAGNEGYLSKELSAVDPAYLIGLGTDVHRLLNRVYQIESLGGTFSREIASGDSKSGFRALNVENENFTYIPTSHPARGVPGMTTDQLKLEAPKKMSKSERYYETFAEDFVNQVTTGAI